MMKQYSVALLALLATTFCPSLTSASCTDDEFGNSDILTLVCADDNLSTLCTWLKETGIDAQLTQSGDFYLFAPINSAFVSASNQAGYSLRQRQATLEYHISAGTADGLECGNTRASNLNINGVTLTSTTVCTDNTPTGQVGNVRVPVGSTNIPQFVNADNFVTACNGKIAAINYLMGYDEEIRWFGVFRPGYRGGKGTKGGIIVAEAETVDGTTFTNVVYRGPGRWYRWRNHQTVYAYNYHNVFSPYFHNGGYGAGYYGHGQGYYNRPYGYGAKGYGYGYGAKGYGYGAKGYGYRNNYWYRGRQLDGQNQPSKLRGFNGYEPSEYEPSEYDANDYDYNEYNAPEESRHAEAMYEEEDYE